VPIAVRRRRTDAEHAVLGVDVDAVLVVEVLQDQRRDPDPEVDDLARHELGRDGSRDHVRAGVRHARRSARTR
jgi:hypothetical protein